MKLVESNTQLWSAMVVLVAAATVMAIVVWKWVRNG